MADGSGVRQRGARLDPPGPSAGARAGLVLALVALAAGAHAAPPRVVRELAITILADGGTGWESPDWGFAALVEADGRRVLFDTARSADRVLENLRALGVDLADVTDVVLSHCHPDHVGGLIGLRHAFMKRNPAALSRVHLAPGCFWPRVTPAGQPARANAVRAGWKRAFEQLGGTFIEHAGPATVVPGVVVTGPVPRVSDERSWDGVPARATRPDGARIEEPVPEDQALVIATARGHVVLTGCGHAGVVNLATYARALTAGATKLRAPPLLALVGGLHLRAATETRLAGIGARLKTEGLRALVGAHCTGAGPLRRLRALTGLSHRACTGGGPGTRFSLARGIARGRLQR